MRGHEKSTSTLVTFLFSCIFTFARVFPLTNGNSLASSSTTTVGNGGAIANAAPIFNVTRVFNSGDVFSNADPRCDPKSCLVLGATVVRSSPCHCQCPNRAPAFLQHVRQCANSIEECRMLEFNQSGNRQRIPTLFLPLARQSIASSSPIDWEGAGIRLDANGSLPCTISGSGYLTQNGWIPLDSEGIFSLQSTSGHTFIQWLGSKQDQLLLTGKVVQVTFRCVVGNAADFCAVFRVIGKDGPLSLDGSASAPQWGASTGGGGTSSNERANQLGLIVGIVCGALLAVTLVSVAVFWTVCWKQQKERLARKIQLHVLYQQQRMQQQAATGAFPHLANAFTAMNEPAVSSTIEMLQNYGGVTYSPYLEPGQQQCWMDPQQQRQNEEMARRYLVDQRGGLLMASNQPGMIDPRGAQSTADQLILPPPPPYPHARKKLYFSPEFFEPDLMVDPPPVAEEFLYEVRRMIDLAKNRIRSRRYIPSLLVIPEEGASRGMDPERKISDASTYSCGSGRSHTILERRDSFSKMAQEPAPEETLTIQELEHDRGQADSPRSSGSADSRTAADSSGGGPPSSSSGCDGGGGDRSSGEAISGGRISLDSGLGGDEDSSSTVKKSTAVASSTSTNESGGDKVSHWLSRLPPTMEIEETDLLNQQQTNNVKHSKLFDYFNARQRLAQNHKLDRLTDADDRNNIIRVQVNEDAGGPQQHNSPPLASSASSSALDTSSNPTTYRRRYSIPLVDGGGRRASLEGSSDYWQYRNPELAALAPASAYFERLRGREQHHQADVHNTDQQPLSSADMRRSVFSSSKYGSEATAASASGSPGDTKLTFASNIDEHPYMNGFSQANGGKTYCGRPISASTQFVTAASPSPLASAPQGPSHSAYFAYTCDESA